MITGSTIERKDIEPLIDGGKGIFLLYQNAGSFDMPYPAWCQKDISPVGLHAPLEPRPIRIKAPLLQKA